MSSNSNDRNDSYSKGFILGALAGGAVGAVVALLFAPKSGSELRRDIADKSTEVYNDVYARASELTHDGRDRMERFVNEGKRRADDLVKSTREQASHLLYEAEGLIGEARVRVNTAQEEIKSSLNKVRDAAGEARATFKREMSKDENANSKPAEIKPEDA